MREEREKEERGERRKGEGRKGLREEGQGGTSGGNGDVEGGRAGKARVLLLTT